MSDENQGNGKLKIPERTRKVSKRGNYAVRLQNATVEKLRIISKRTGRSINEIVHMAIDNIE